MSGNSADGTAGSGGAILNNGGTLRVSGGTIQNNDSNRAGGGIESNGAAQNTLAGVTLRGNSTGGDADNAPGNGGALHITGAGNASVLGGAVADNSAQSEGGGLWNSTAGTLLVDGTSFRGNVASGDQSDNGGGAIYGDGGKLSVRNASFNGNSADGAAGSGGAILNKGGVLELRASTFSVNRSMRAGGAIELVDGSLTSSGSNFSGNATGAAPGNGGVLHITGAGAALIAGGTFNNNSASGEGRRAMEFGERHFNGGRRDFSQQQCGGRGLG